MRLESSFSIGHGAQRESLLPITTHGSQQDFFAHRSVTEERKKRHFYSIHLKPHHLCSCRDQRSSAALQFEEGSLTELGAEGTPRAQITVLCSRAFVSRQHASHTPRQGG